MTDLNLGKFLRQLRLGATLTVQEKRLKYRKVSQLALAHRMNWSYATHVSEIENGQRLPNADTIARWVNACGGTEKALHLASGLAGYIPRTPMPDKDELIALLDPIVERDLRDYPYPAFILDHRNIVWAMTAGTQVVYDEGELPEIMKRPLSLFHNMFDSRTTFYNMLTNRDEVQRQQVIRLQAINIRHQHEAFYRNMPSLVGQYLSPEDAAHFRNLWQEFYDNYYSQPEVSHQRDVKVRFSTGKQVTYRPSTDIIASYDSIFAVAFLRPDTATLENVFHADAAANPYRDENPFKLWELCDIQPIIDDYNRSSPRTNNAL